MTPAAPCEFLAWDSEFFGRRIARLTAGCLTPDTLIAVTNWCAANTIECLYFLSSSDDMLTVRLAEANQFRLVDVRVTLELSLGEPASGRPDLGGASTRPFRPDDIPTLREIARTSFRHTRFYNDDHFAVSQCDALYETWVEKSCAGWAEAVLVAEQAGRVIGFVSCHRPNAETGQIGLLAVSAEAHNQHVGQRLVRAALDRFGAQQVGRVTVTTQGTNVKAQRLYQRSGFLTQSLELWYHRWFPSPIFASTP